MVSSSEFDLGTTLGSPWALERAGRQVGRPPVVAAAAVWSVERRRVRSSCRVRELLAKDADAARPNPAGGR